MSRAVNFNLHATRAYFLIIFDFYFHTGWLASQSDLMFMTSKMVHIEGMDVDFCFHKKNIQKCNGFVTDGRVEYQTSFFDQLDPERMSVTKPLHIQIFFW